MRKESNILNFVHQKHIEMLQNICYGVLRFCATQALRHCYVYVDSYNVYCIKFHSEIYRAFSTNLNFMQCLTDIKKGGSSQFECMLFYTFDLKLEK